MTDAIRNPASAPERAALGQMIAIARTVHEREANIVLVLFGYFAGAADPQDVMEHERDFVALMRQ